jgi:hypothetical protein
VVLTPDQRIDRFAARHHGLATRAVAAQCGLSDGQIDSRLMNGRFVALAPSVYRVSAAPITWRQTAMAACLAGPPGTATSHLTSAALFGLARPSTPPDITVPPSASGRIRMARVHRSPLAALDRRTVDGIPTTSVARTLIDCAGVVPFSRLCDMVDTAFCSMVCHPVAVAAAIDRAQRGRGKKGVTALRAAISAWTPDISPGSPAEMRLLRRIAQAGLEPPQRQIELFDSDGEFIGRIDIGWPRLRAGLEYDSDRYHNPRHWARDETRQRRYHDSGWDVHRVGKYDLLPSVVWLDEHLRGLGQRLAA